MSMLAEEFEGKTLDELHKFSEEDMYEMLGVPIGPRRVKCALLGLEAIQSSLKEIS